MNPIKSSDLDAWIAEAVPFIPRMGSVEPGRLLKALCWQESSYGSNAVPRHENSFCPNQKAVSAVARNRHHQFGCLACCSYGPLQVLFHSLADLGIVDDPLVLLDAKVAFHKAIAFLVRKIMRDHPTTVSAVADIWNSGNFHDTIIPTGYINSVETHYTRMKA